jgi:outer membrane receptor protein involved in Fe transport
MYDYTGRVSIQSLFAQEAFELRPDLRVTGSLQWRRTRYAVGRDLLNGYDFRLRYTSLNPRLGVNWNASKRWNLFGSFAHVQAEPILTEIYRADDRPPCRTSACSIREGSTRIRWWTRRR